MFEAQVLAAVVARFQARLKTRILFFGSSNTEHFLAGMHWTHVFELAVHATYGRVHHCINTGVGGHKASDLLARFEDDAAFYHPHLVFITVGGNDHFQKVPFEDYRGNLLELHRRFAGMGCAVVFQTYYAFDPARCGDLAGFYRNMEIVREVAVATGSGLIDHLARWEAFRLAHPDRYLSLMNDAHHVNHRGNMVIGLDVARHFHAAPGQGDPAFWKEPLEIQKLMDALNPCI